LRNVIAREIGFQLSVTIAAQAFERQPVPVNWIGGDDYGRPGYRSSSRGCKRSDSIRSAPPHWGQN